MEWSFQTGSVSPPKSFSPGPLCSLVFVPLLSNVLRPEASSLRGGIPPHSLLSGELGCKRMNWVNVKVPLREKRKKFLIVVLSREQIRAPRGRQRMSVRMLPGLGCVSVSLEGGWRTGCTRGLCFKGGQAKKKKKSAS
jgi:hypothetical protein